MWFHNKNSSISWVNSTSARCMCLYRLLTCGSGNAFRLRISSALVQRDFLKVHSAPQLEQTTTAALNRSQANREEMNATGMEIGLMN